MPRPSEIAGSSPPMRLWRFVCLWFVAFAAPALAGSPWQLSPATLEVRATQNEPVVLRLEVLADHEPGALDLRADGMGIQREIRRPAPRRREFLIEPDTSRAGPIHGWVTVVSEEGQDIGRVPVTGEVRPFLRVAPSRLFLGPLEYGSRSMRKIDRQIELEAPGAWKVLAVEVEGLPDVDWQAEELEPGRQRLRLRFAEDALKAGEPFGAFIKRAIRIKTDLEAAPEISVPLTAMLSVNASARDFNIYRFKGRERWQGPWATPNVAAAVVGPWLLLLLGYGGWCWRRWLWPAWLRWGVAALWGLAVAAAGFRLGQTYSRGGWLAFLLGLAAMTFAWKGSRRWLLGAGGAFLLLLALLPAGVERAASAGALAEDGSIAHRLLVWRGAIEMIADYPGGVGAGRFGEVLARYYQEPWHTEIYATALNDGLNLAAEHGWEVVLAGLALAGFIVAGSARQMTQGGGGAAPLLGAATALFVASQFSTLGSVLSVRLLAAGLFGSLALSWAVRAFRPHSGGRRWPGDAAAALGLIATLAGAAAWVNLSRSVRHAAVTGAGGETSQIQYAPGHRPALGTVVFLAAEHASLDLLGRQVLRPLAEQGWRAVAIELPAYDQPAIGALSRYLEGCAAPPVLLAEGAKARVALGVARRAPADRQPRVVLISPKVSSPLPECDQSDFADRLPARVSLLSLRQWLLFRKNPQAEAEAVARELARPDSTGSPSRLATLDHPYPDQPAPERATFSATKP